MTRWRRAALTLLVVGQASGQEPTDDPLAVSFERDVAPILAAHCQGCHQPAKSSAGVLLVSHADLVGGDAPLVEPGSVEDSPILDVVTPLGDLPATMPPEGDPLSAAEVAILKRWITQGAADDSSADTLGPRDASGFPIYTRPPVVTALAYAPDGRTLAVSGRGEVLLHDVEDDDAPPVRLVGLADRVESLAYSPDGARLAVAGGVAARRGEVQVWNVEERELVLSMSVTHDTLHGVSWSGDGTRLAFGAADNTVRVVLASDGREVLFQGAHTDWVLGTTFSSDDSHLVTVSRDRSMKLIKVDSQQFIDNITSITPGALRGGLMSVARRPGGDELLVGGADGVPKTYRTYREKKRVIGDDYNLLRAFEKIPGRVFSVAWSGDGSRFVVGASLRGSGVVRVYDPEQPAPVWTRDVPTGVFAVAFRPDGGEVVAGGYDGVLRVLAAEDGTVVRERVAVPLAARTEEVAAR